MAGFILTSYKVILKAVDAEGRLDFFLDLVKEKTIY